MARAGGVLTAAVGISAVISHFGGTASNPPISAAKSGPTISVGGRASKDTLAAELDDFSSNLKTKQPAITGRRKAPSIKIVIASVPDPEKTNLKLQFDRAVESIERAAAKSHYIFRQHWLPWETTQHHESDDPEKRAKTEKNHRDRLAQAGVLLFDSDKDVEAPLAIFLVGESPISGVDQTQLHSALSYHKKHSQFKGFLGPTFSGSWSGLKAFAVEHREATFYTTSTSMKRQKDFGLPSFPQRIHTTSYTSESELGALYVYLSNNWDTKIAALVAEDETSYSSGVIQALQPAETTSNEQHSETTSNKQHYLVFNFPRELSRLRNAARDPSNLVDSKRNDYDLSPLVALTLRDNSQSADIPDFSKDQTPVSQESLLLQISNEINRKHVQYSGVLATDVLDSIFINQFLHSLNINTRIFQTEPDLLLAHGADSNDFQGMLVVNGFPLFAQLNDWGQKSPTDNALFPSAESAGVYNNLLVMLTRDSNQEAIGYYADPTGTIIDKHPLWLTVLGRNGFWPLDVLPTTSNDDPYLEKACKAAGTLSIDNPTRLWWACFCLTTMACITLTILDRVIKPDGDKRLTLFTVKVDEFGLPARAFWLAMLSLSLALLEGVWTVMPLRIWTAQAFHDPISWKIELYPSIVGCFAIAAVFSTAVRAALRIGKGQDFGNFAEEKFQARFYQTLASVAFAVFFASLGLGHSFIASAARAPTFFLAYRSINLASGVSPLVPATFILIGFCVYAYLNLQRVNFHVDRRPWVPELKDDLYCSQLHRVAASICARIYGLRFHRGDLLIGATFTIAGGFYVYVHAHQSVEPALYENCFLLALVALFSLMAVACYRLFGIWLPFHEFLRSLERHPLKRGFSRLPKDFVWSPTWQGGSTQRTHVLISRSVDCIRSIISCTDAPVSLRQSMQSAYDSMFDDVKAVIFASQQQKRIESATYGRLQKQLGKAGETIAEHLSPTEWKKGNYEVYLSKAGDKQEAEDRQEDASSKYSKAGEQFLVYRYLAFVNYVLMQQQKLITIMTALFVLLALALNSYPFLSRSVITGVITIAFAAVVITIVSIFSALDRDPILSRTTGTDGGQLDRFFVIKILAYVSLPLLAVLGSYFPPIGHFMFSWLAPAAEALH